MQRFKNVLSMSSKYPLTVILITYNHEKWIEKAIESILEQETNFPFVIKIFEDCSTDGTANICKEYAKKHPDKIRLFLAENNIGVAKTFKKAFLEVKTKYFTFLEGDDYWCEKSKLQQQVDTLEKHPECSMCGHDTKIFDLRTGNKSYIFDNNLFKKGYVAQDKNYIFPLEEAPYIHTSSRMYRSGLVDFTSEPDWLCVDIYHYYKFLSKGKIYFINKIMSVYNLTGLGDYTKYNQLEKNLQYYNAMLTLNKYFKYKYADFFGKSLLKSSGARKLCKKYPCLNRLFFFLTFIERNIQYKFLIWKAKK